MNFNTLGIKLSTFAINEFRLSRPRLLHYRDRQPLHSGNLRIIKGIVSVIIILLFLTVSVV